MRSARTALLRLRSLHHHHHHHHQAVGIIGAPLSRGQPRAGAELGPDAIRAVGLITRLKQNGVEVKDYGNLTFDAVADDEPVGVVKHVRAVGGANQRLSEAVQMIKGAGLSSVVLGGDHSSAIGSIHGHAAALGSALSVVWIDAHADINTPLTTPTGNLHGQPLSFLLHELSAKVPALPQFSWIKPCLSAKDLLFIGLRITDPAEAFILKTLGVKVFSMAKVDKLGIGQVMEESCDFLAARKKRIHVSYDIDALDPSVSPATGTPQEGGLTYREGVTIAEHLYQTGLVSGVDLVEVNPLLAQNQQELDSTTKAALDVLLALFGEQRGENVPADFCLPDP